MSRYCVVAVDRAVGAAQCKTNHQSNTRSAKRRQLTPAAGTGKRHHQHNPRQATSDAAGHLSLLSSASGFELFLDESINFVCLLTGKRLGFIRLSLSCRLRCCSASLYDYRLPSLYSQATTKRVRLSLFLSCLITKHFIPICLISWSIKFTIKPGGCC